MAPIERVEWEHGTKQYLKFHSSRVPLDHFVLIVIDILMFLLLTYTIWRVYTKLALFKAHHLFPTFAILVCQIRTHGHVLTSALPCR